MTKKQGLQLGQALIAWSYGYKVMARTTEGADISWISFNPEMYEKLFIAPDMEWMVVTPIPPKLLRGNKKPVAK